MKKGALILLCGAIVVSLSLNSAVAIQPFFTEFKEKYVKPDGTDTEKELAAAVEKVKCNVCHKGKKSKKDRNAYGEALAELLDKQTDKKDKEKIVKALDTVSEQKSGDDGPTFGELIEQGKLPGGEE